MIELTKWDKGPLPNVLQATGEESASCPDWDGFTRYPCVAQTPTNGAFSYRFKMQNIGNIDATDHVMYDILPYVGDTGVSQVLSSQARGTEWSPVLTGAVQVLDRPEDANVTVLYNLSTNPCRPEVAQGSADANWQTSCDNTWYTAAQVSDWSEVKSFKVSSFADGKAWKPMEEILLQADMQAPATALPSKFDPLDLSAAWNSVAHRVYRLNVDKTKARLLAAEPRKVGIIVPFEGVSIGDYVWYDVDRDGIQDADELPAEKVTVTLYDANGALVGSTETNADGYYYFQYLKEGKEYSLTFTPPSGYKFTSQNALSDSTNSPTGDVTDSDVNADGVVTFTTPLDGKNLAEPGKADNPGLDAGLVSIKVPVSIGDYTWYDTNKNGIQDDGELPASGVTVTLFKDGVEVGSTVTDSDGYYFFADLDPSTEYKVTFTAPQNYKFTKQDAAGVTSNSPTEDVSDSDADPTTGSVTFTTPALGSNKTAPGEADNPGIDAGFVALVSIGDYVWLDTNRDGL